MKFGMEGLPNEKNHESKELGKETSLERLKSTADSFLTSIANRLEHGLPSIDSPSLDRVRDGARKIMSVALKATLIGSLAVSSLAVQHGRTRYEISEQGTEGSKEYVHQDERTTHILNYLLGKAELSSEDRVFFYRYAAQQLLENELLPVPANLNDLTEEEVIALVAETFKLNPAYPPETTFDKAREYLEKTIARQDFNQQLYESVWELQQRVGAPRIRWSAEGEDATAALMSKTAGSGRAFYDPVSNTIYLTPGDPSTVLVDENAHAKQFNDRPVRSYAQLTSSWIRSGIRSLTQFEDLRTSYSYEYERAGSIEHDAHQVMVPELITETEDDYSRRLYRTSGHDAPPPRE